MTSEQVLGKRLGELRRARGWSQEELARRMTDAGFSWWQTTVAKTEKADRPVRVNEATALAHLFGVGIERLTTPEQSLTEDLERLRQDSAEPCIAGAQSCVLRALICPHR